MAGIKIRKAVIDLLATSICAGIVGRQNECGEDPFGYRDAAPFRDARQLLVFDKMAEKPHVVNHSHAITLMSRFG